MSCSLTMSDVSDLLCTRDANDVFPECRLIICRHLREGKGKVVVVLFFCARVKVDVGVVAGIPITS